MFGIKAFIYNSEVNKNIESDVERVQNWLELENKIKK